MVGPIGLYPPQRVQLGYSPAFRSANGRSEREGMLSSTTSPAFRSANGRSEREGMLSSTTSLEFKRLFFPPEAENTAERN